MIRLNDEQLKQLAEFASNLSLIFVAIVVTPLFSKEVSVNIFNVLTGLTFMAVCLIISLFLLKRIKR